MIEAIPTMGRRDALCDEPAETLRRSIPAAWATQTPSTLEYIHWTTNHVQLPENNQLVMGSRLVVIDGPTPGLSALAVPVQDAQLYGLRPHQRFRLVGVGLSNFCDPENGPAQSALFT